jgi:hypothetical protein
MQREKNARCAVRVSRSQPSRLPTALTVPRVRSAIRPASRYERKTRFAIQWRRTAQGRADGKRSSGIDWETKRVRNQDAFGR